MPPIPNHLDVVKAARARYADLAGPKRAHHVVNAVAWTLRDEGAGLLFKRSGSQFNERSLDVIIFREGQTFDVLRDAEGRAEPSWSRTEPTGMGDPQNWRAATDPVVLDEGLNLPNPVDVVAELTAIRSSIDALIRRLA